MKREGTEFVDNGDGTEVSIPLRGLGNETFLAMDIELKKQIAKVSIPLRGLGNETIQSVSMDSR